MRGGGALPAGETCSSSAGAICGELAGWPSGPWLLPTVTSVTHKLLRVPNRLEENERKKKALYSLIVAYFHCWCYLKK